MAAKSIRIEAPIPGKQAVGIEVPNEESEVVHIRDILQTDEFKENVNKQKQIGQTIIYKPDATSENQIFTTKDENIVNTIEYVGDTKSNFRELKILNQGDKLAFRVANKDVCSYESNDEETINHNELLKKANLTKEDISLNLSFDMFKIVKMSSNV